MIEMLEFFYYLFISTFSSYLILLKSISDDLDFYYENKLLHTYNEEKIDRSFHIMKN